MKEIDKWDWRFIELCSTVAKWSKDPSTKCGSVIVRPDRTIASLGFNGFPRGMSDKYDYYYDREKKYDRIIHAEVNAILNAREPLMGYTLYCWPFPTCSRCAVQIIQSGIKRVVSPRFVTVAEIERWGKSTALAETYYEEAGVEVVVL